jgi:hypothetical protein
MDPLPDIAIKRRELEQSCQHGFPVIDNLYWDRPSPMVGGWLIINLERLDPPARGSRIDLRFPTRRSTTLAQVIATLKAEHRPGFCYRGQRKRRSCFYKGLVPAIERHERELTPMEVTLDALVPSAFRHLTHVNPAAWKNFKLLPPTERLAGPLRAIMASSHTGLHDRVIEALEYMAFDSIRLLMIDRAVLTYDLSLLAHGTTVAQHMLDLISVAQHYEYGSIMVDTTRDIDTAAWFATHNWSTGELAKSIDGSSGVIYRFDGQNFSTMMENHLTGAGATPPPSVQTLGVFGLADLSDTFDFLARPRAQHGGSLLGLENVVTHFMMSKMHSVAEAFPFDHSTVTGKEISLTRDDICPRDDEGVRIFCPDNKFPSHPITPVELEAFLVRIGVEESRRGRLVEWRRTSVI